MCPACGNGMDDDSDGQIDYPMDPGCIAASSTTELGCVAETDPIIVISGPATTGTAVGAANDFDPTCQSNDLGDRVHIITFSVPVATLTLDTLGSAMSDPILMFMNATCGLPPIACNDDAIGLQSEIVTTNVAAGTYAIVLDTYGGSSMGGYTLNVHGTLPAGGSCASPLVAAGVLTCPGAQTRQANVCAP
jgi:hypothetical protein